MIQIHRFLPALAASGALAALTGCTPNDAFVQLDVNRNGSGSRDEFSAYMKQEVFNRVDTNRDGKVVKAEWQHVNPKMDSTHFRKIDRNQDGAMTRAETDAAFEREGSLKRLFQQIDADGNGSLSSAEVANFDAKVRQQPGATPTEKLTKATTQS